MGAVVGGPLPVRPSVARTILDRVAESVMEEETSWSPRFFRTF